MRFLAPLFALSITVSSLVFFMHPSQAEAPHTEAPHTRPRPVLPTPIPTPLLPGPPAPSTAKPAKNAEAINLLREAYRRTADEERPDQRDIMLAQVSEWLSFAGDDASAEQAAKDVRTIARTYKEPFERASHLRRVARLLGLAGAANEAWVTCREIKSQNEHDYAIKETAEALAKRDNFDGMWDALPEIKTESLKLFAMMPVAESCLRRDDTIGWEKALALVPEPMRRNLISSSAGYLTMIGRSEDADALREHYGISKPQQTGWVGPLQRFADAEAVSVDEVFQAAAQFTPRIPMPGHMPSQQHTLVMGVAQQRFQRGDLETAQAICSRVMQEVETEAGREAEPDKKIDYPGDLNPAVSVSTRDQSRALASEKLCLLASFNNEAAGGPLSFYRRAIQIAQEIQNPQTQGFALQAIAIRAFAFGWLPIVREVASVTRDPGHQATLLIRLAREETFAESPKQALETLRAAERVTTRITSLPLRVEVYSALTMARKRAGDIPGAEKAMELARGNFEECPEHLRNLPLPLLAQANAEVENLEEAHRVVGKIIGPNNRVSALIRMAYAYIPDARPSRRLDPTLLGASQLPNAIR